MARRGRIEARSYRLKDAFVGCIPGQKYVLLDDGGINSLRQFCVEVEKVKRLDMCTTKKRSETLIFQVPPDYSETDERRDTDDDFLFFFAKKKKGQNGKAGKRKGIKQGGPAEQKTGDPQSSKQQGNRGSSSIQKKKQPATNTKQRSTVTVSEGSDISEGSQESDTDYEGDDEADEDDEGDEDETDDPVWESSVVMVAESSLKDEVDDESSNSSEQEVVRGVTEKSSDIPSGQLHSPISDHGSNELKEASKCLYTEFHELKREQLKQYEQMFAMVNSPSGNCSSTDNLSTCDQPSPARKVRDNQKSSIVNTGVGIDTNGNLKRSTLSPRHQQSTKNRLFGPEGDANGEASPRRSNDTWRSHIAFGEADGSGTDGTQRTPKKRAPTGGMNVNPITGSPFHGHTNGFTPSQKHGASNGHSQKNGVSNGHSYDHDDVLTVVLGSEGTDNGPVASLNGHGDHSSPRRRPAQAQ